MASRPDRQSAEVIIEGDAVLGAGSAPSDFLSGRWPLVGRAEEMRFIADSITGPAGYAGVVLGGAAGVGKTRLARDALAAATRQTTGFWLTASSAARSVALGAFAQWVPAEPADPVHLVGKVIAGLIDTAPDGLVVAIDDAHLLDDVSTFVVHQLAHRRLAAMILTVRTGEPMSAAIAGLWRDGLLRRLDLQTLGQGECLQLLEQVLGGRLDAASARRLWRLTGGNALYLRHVVAQEQGAGRLRRDSGRWTWVGDLVVSASLQGLIESRMGVLPSDVADVVDLVAVAEPLPTRMLAELVDSAAIEQAELRGLVVVEDGDKEGQVVQLAHPLYGELRRARAGKMRLRRLRGMVAARLAEETVRDHHHVLRQAVLALDSDLPPDPSELLNAAEVAVWHSDHELGLRLARAACAAGGGWSAELACAAQLANMGHGAEAGAILSALDTHNVPGPERVQVDFVRAWNLFANLGRVDEAETVLERARDESAEPIAIATLDSLRSLIVACRPAPVEAVRLADATLSCDGLPGLPAILAIIAKVIGLGELGRADELAPLAESAAKLCELSTTTAYHRWTFNEFFTWELRLAGYFADSGQAIDGLRGPSWTPNSDAVIELMHGCAELAVGRAESASRRIREVMPRLGPEFEALGWLYRNRITLTEACAIAGDHDGAVDALRDADASAHATFAFHRPHHMLAQAWVWACEGAASEAIDHARLAADTAAAHNQFAQEVLCLQAATLFGDATTSPRLTQLAETVDGPRVATAAVHAAALQDGDGDRLLAASKQYEEMGDVLSAADAAAQAAVSFSERGLRGSALTAAARVHNFVGQCGTVDTPALAAFTAPLMFTERQREVISLAASGLSNRQIAQRLHLSTRTVEGHLHRAAARAGAGDRNQLSRILRGDGT